MKPYAINDLHDAHEHFKTDDLETCPKNTCTAAREWIARWTK